MDVGHTIYQFECVIDSIVKPPHPTESKPIDKLTISTW